MLLVHFIRETPGLTGTHWGCDTSNCGACVVQIDGEPVKSCTTLAAMCEGHEIRTVESLEVDGQLDPIQMGFHEPHALQCGFCTPGHADDDARPARREPRSDRARDPYRDLGRHLPLHRLQEHRRAPCAGPPSTKPLPNRRSEHGRPSRTFRAPPTERPIGFGRLKRKEDARFIRGQGTYLDDIRLPGMVHGAILRSPYAHARIVSIDTSRALAHPNVAAVVTAKDLETLGLAWMPTISYDTQAVLAGDKVRFQGQEVAFVIATDEYSANDALAADRRRVRAAAGDRQRAQGARPRRAADPRRQGRPARQPREPDLGGRRRGGDRPGVRRGRHVVVARHHLSALPPGAARDVRHDRRLQPGDRPARHLQRQPGAARAPHGLRARRRASPST